MSAELVLLHHNEPMTTSLAIAEGVEMTHHSVLVLIRKHAEHLAKFGPCEFQIHVVDRPQGGGSNREVFFLNEQQATLLITFMRNSPIVIRFKVALVKAFFELRDRLKAVAAPQFTTGNLAHGADLVVAADRTFRSFLRAARSAGMPLPAALRVANQQTQTRTGMDMLAELGQPVPDETVPRHDPYGVDEFVALWLAGELPVPVTHCRSTDLYAAYAHWRREGVAPINIFGSRLLRADARISKRIVWIRHGDAERQNARAVILPWLDQYGDERAHRLAEEFERFADALVEWKQ